MAKYKRRFKLNKTSSIAIVLIFILISMSVGYCLWTDSNTVIGNITVKYKEPRIYGISVVEEDGYYVTKDEQNKLINAYERAKFAEGNLIENKDKIEICGNFDTYNELIPSKRTVTISSKFVNNTGYTLTSMQYEKLAETELNEKMLGYDTTISVPDDIAQGETATLIISFTVPGTTYAYKKDRKSII